MELYVLTRTDISHFLREKTYFIDVNYVYLLAFEQYLNKTEDLYRERLILCMLTLV